LIAMDNAEIKYSTVQNWFLAIRRFLHFFAVVFVHFYIKY
jgi:hypothetical protein